MRALLWTLLALAPACASHRNFAPRENCNGQGPGRQPAAVYPVQADGAAGEVRVWSAGSSRRDGAGPEGTEVHLGFEIENTGSQPLRLDLESLRCDELRAGDEVLGPLPAARVEGNPEAAPGTTGRVDAWFLPGPGIAPRDVDSFAARFVVRCADQAVCNQVTPFQPYSPDSHYRHDPWLWGGFGFGIGWWGSRRPWR
ncbi:MAG: hypothetical protein Q7T30_01275 [Planctomycetota bacterium]|nr:hypothetical protein [Planctomycetota bacterium]